MELGFIRLAGAMGCIEDRAEANAAFTQVPTSPRGERTGGGRPLWLRVRTGALGAGVLVLVALVLGPRLRGALETGGGSTEPLSAERMTWMSKQNIPSGIGYPMPKGPFPEQTRPPCEGAEVEIRGGCWFQGKQDAPCPKGTAEHEGKCYVPVHEKTPAPRSLEP